MLFYKELIMRKFQAGIFLFLIVLSIISIMAFTSAFIAFSEIEIFGDRLRDFCYHTFLLFRYPFDSLVVLKMSLPKIQHQLLASSLLYALIISTLSQLIFRIRFRRSSSLHPSVG